MDRELAANVARRRRDAAGAMGRMVRFTAPFVVAAMVMTRRMLAADITAFIWLEGRNRRPNRKIESSSCRAGEVEGAGSEAE